MTPHAPQANGIRWILVIAVTAFLTTGATALAQSVEKGKIIGTVVSAEAGDPLPYANVILFRLESAADTLGTNVGGTFTMAPDGKYRLETAPGTYRVLVSHVSHESVQARIDVKAGEAVTLDLALGEVALTIDDKPVEIRAKRVTNTDAALLARQRRASAVSDAISSQQIKQTADSDAAEALQRVTGLSLVGGKYVFVRGLGERYSSTQVNGATIGSPEANKRVVPLDLIPAALLDNITVQKTYTPDKPGEFGGGNVDISTQDFPGHESWSISLGSGVNSSTTGKDFLTYNGGGTDFFGFDDGTRNLPGIIPKKKVKRAGLAGIGFTAEEIEKFGESFNRTWTPKTDTGLPKSNINASYGNEVLILGRPLGFIAGGVFNRNYQSYDHEENIWREAPHVQYDATTSKASTRLAFNTTSSFRLDNSNAFYLRSVYNRTAEDEARFYEGDNYDSNTQNRSTRFLYLERTIFSNNAGMSHTIPTFNNAILEWRLNYSRATRSEPDRREYTYENDSSDPDNPDWRLSTRTASLGFTRIYGGMEEDTRGAEAHLTLPFRLRGHDAKVKLGASTSNKDRGSSWRRFHYRDGRGLDLSLPPDSLLTDENIAGTTRDGFELVELTRPSDKYLAHQDIDAAYLMFEVPVLRQLRLVAGARVEDSRQEVVTIDQFPTADSTRVVNEGLIEQTDYLPAVNVVYAFSERTNIRGAYSKTISRPDLREMAGTSFDDYTSAVEYKGNPDLRRTQIFNYDLRVEHFPGLSEILAVSFFYKEFEDPIETTIRIAGGGLVYQPANGRGGRLYGTEIEGRLRLERLSAALRSFRAGANLTFVESETKLPRTGQQTSSERPLAGQSPYVVNLMLFYEPEGSPLQASAVYNVFGERLDKAGVGVVPDIYEKPRHSVDATVGYTLGGLGFKLAVENILNDDILFEQGFDEGEEVITKYRTGRSISLGVSRSL